MPNLATWIRPKDEKSFRAIFARHPEIRVWNALNRKVPFEQMNGLLLTGGSDISPEFLRQEIVDPGVIHKDVDSARDRWEFEAVWEGRLVVMTRRAVLADLGRRFDITSPSAAR